MPQFVELSNTQRKKLRGQARIEYEIDLAIFEEQRARERAEAYELSNERLKERIDALEERLANLDGGVT